MKKAYIGESDWLFLFQIPQGRMGEWEWLEFKTRMDRELSDPGLAEKALIECAKGLYRIWSCR